MGCDHKIMAEKTTLWFPKQQCSNVNKTGQYCLVPITNVYPFWYNCTSFSNMVHFRLIAPISTSLMSFAIHIDHKTLKYRIDFKWLSFTNCIDAIINPFSPLVLSRGFEAFQSISVSVSVNMISVYIDYQLLFSGNQANLTFN